MRYLRARSRNGFISFISAVSIVGIALAVAVLIVVLSVMNGFEHEMQKRILGMVSDATLTGLEETIDDWQALRATALERDDIGAGERPCWWRWVANESVSQWAAPLQSWPLVLVWPRPQ
jgi:ABC-type lipoprotein release transport system permease subunit